MKPAVFDFKAPDTLGAALEIMNMYGDDARVLAGGQSLVPLMNLRMIKPEIIVSINRCSELDFVQVEGAKLSVGALVRQRVAEHNTLVQSCCPLLAKALPYLGATANRNRGTVCGSIAHADPLGELPAVALALDAQMVVSGINGERKIAAVDFFLGDLETDIRVGEVLRAVEFQKQESDELSVFQEVGNRRHGFAVAGLAVRLGMMQGQCSFARIAVMGAGSTARRIEEAENLLSSRVLNERIIEQAVESVVSVVEPIDDVHADADYRRNVLGVLLRRTLGMGASH